MTNDEKYYQVQQKTRQGYKNVGPRHPSLHAARALRDSLQRERPRTTFRIVEWYGNVLVQIVR